MRYLTSLFTKKEKKENYFELPSRKQKHILRVAAKGASEDKKALVRKYSIRYSNQ